MILELYDLDAIEGEPPICSINPGEHSIGRGELLKCNDKRVSRNHALIKIPDDNEENGQPTLTSTHQNPCFFQLANQKTILILDKDAPKLLRDGDKFGLFPDKFWFRIKITHLEKDDKNPTTNNDREEEEFINNENENEEIQETDNEIKNNEEASEDNSFVFNLSSQEDQDQEDDAKNSNIKEKDEEDGNKKTEEEELTDNNTQNNNEEIINKEQENGNENDEKIEENAELNLTTTVTIQQPLNEDKEELSSNVIIKEEAVLLPKQEEANTQIQNSVKLEEVKEEVEDKDKAATSNQINNNGDEEGTSSGVTGTGTKRKHRERCMFREKCYRKNPVHKEEYSHPGDSDYDSDPNDTRPECPYGAHCYRKNPDHKKEYKHPKNAAPPRKQRRTRNLMNANSTTNYESSEDDYDVDDPFIDDMSEDEYIEESWSEGDDEDDEDLLNDGENDENEDEEQLGSLLSQAKRFVKQKRNAGQKK